MKWPSRNLGNNRFRQALYNSAAAASQRQEDQLTVQINALKSKRSKARRSRESSEKQVADLKQEEQSFLLRAEVQA